MVPEEYFDAIADQLPEGSVRGLVQEHVQGLPVVPEGRIDYYGEQGQYLGQYEQQQEQYLQYDQQQGQYLQYEQQQQQGQYLGGQYEQQQGPASPGFAGELTAEQSSENLSMSMTDFMMMINEQPVEMVNEQPAETVNWEEPSWESLPDIFEADEFAKF
jgi:hypothetical protein